MGNNKLLALVTKILVSFLPVNGKFRFRWYVSTDPARFPRKNFVGFKVLKGGPLPKIEIIDDYGKALSTEDWFWVPGSKSLGGIESEAIRNLFKNCHVGISRVDRFCNRRLSILWGV